MALCTDVYGAYVDCTDPSAMFQPNSLTPVTHTATGAAFDTQTLSVLILISAVCLVLCVKLARHKGYSTAQGVVGGLLGVIGLIFFALVPAKGAPTTHGRSPERAALEAELVNPETTPERRSQIESLLLVLA